MPRIRTIKPEFWSSPGVAHMSPWARLLFIAMWNWADDFGRGTFNPRELMGFAFPNDEEMTVDVFRTHVDEIRTHVDVDFYRVGERDFFQIPSWKKHQRIDSRLKQSKFPGPKEGQLINPRSGAIIEPVDEKHTHVDVKRTHVDGEPGNVTVGTGEQGNRGEPENTPSLDELAAAYAATEHAPNVYGSAADPRCGKHKNLPSDKVPNCHECAQARHWFETNAATQIDAKRQARRQAIDACNECDDNGWLTTPSGVIRCDHQPAKKAGPY